MDEVDAAFLDGRQHAVGVEAGVVGSLHAVADVDVLAVHQSDGPTMIDLRVSSSMSGRMNRRRSTLVVVASIGSIHIARNAPGNTFIIRFGHTVR